MVTNPTRDPSFNVLSLSLPSPKAPPEYPDLYGKRREMAKIQMLEREISFLEEELKSSEGFQPASKCCTESSVTDEQEQSQVMSFMEVALSDAVFELILDLLLVLRLLLRLLQLQT
ncbi:guanine nucleotide-binding protein subunit gamma [Trifolium repens]|nr:guanine nucleotide-binding protein subunit gamma [Trifolium repens]